MGTPQEDEVKSAAIAKAWEDPAFKLRLLENPPEALKELGAELAKGAELKVMEDTPELHHWVIPMPPPGDVTEEELG